MLEVVSDRLTDAQKDSLNSPLSIEEFGEAIRNLTKLQCLGPDGIQAEFYQKMWLTFGPTLLKLINDSLEKDCRAEWLSLGMILLLP